MEAQVDSHTAWAGILDLPSELIDEVLTYLSPLELASLRQVCKQIQTRADADIHWQRHVRANVPGNLIKSPYPFKSYRELYICHDPFWFIPKHKIWFGDHGLPGRMLIAQYDQRRGVIECYQLLAVNQNKGLEPWLEDPETRISRFNPLVKLHRDKPILRLGPDDYERLDSDEGRPLSHRPAVSERPMHMNFDSDSRVSSLVLAKPLGDAAIKEAGSKPYPYGFMWPTPAIPACQRFGTKPNGIWPLSLERIAISSPKPQSRLETSDKAFHISRRMETGRIPLGVQIGNQTETYSTLDPKLYTPTKEKPWRGIWVGDYNAHGCEFLLIHQPDSEGDKASQPLARRSNETDDQFEERFLRERVYKGALEAIKLTGDVNVPRGEHSFIAKDLSNAGNPRFAREPPFSGARIVSAQGHVAHDDFYLDSWMDTELFLISHDRIAQYWLDFDQIIYYQRVDIDRFTSAL
ncbi:hypothetical protein BX600DRAFT_479149 [Xylariales sp. PMI_506]|nr:hypothetical protein BX600DRAFT_479149 [Xylariales sp. PMI_506]